MPTVHWLGGWASSLVCWKPMLEQAFPKFEHQFLESHSLLKATPFEAGLVGLPAGDVVAGWSMGTLLTHHWLELGLWPAQLPLLSICPVFDFTGGQYGEPILVRMEEKLAFDRELVLLEFWKRMPKSQEFPAIWKDQWIEGAMGYNLSALISGLEFLRSVRINSNSIPAHKPWEILIGEKDPLATKVNRLHALPTSVTITRYPGGHIPFWEFPEFIYEALQRLSQTQNL